MTYVLILDGSGKILYTDEELPEGKLSWETIKTLLEGESGSVLIGQSNYHFRRISLPVGEKGIHIVKLYPMEDSLLRVFSTFIHEFKNPLGAIRALAQALGRRMAGHPDEGKIQEYVRMMIKEIDRLNTLVGSFKFLSRPTVRFMVPFDVAEVVKDTVSLYQEEFFEKGVSLRMEEGEDVPYFGNPDDFHQITANLLKNALEATARGDRVRVTVRAKGEKVIIEVLDTGEGIPDEVLEHLKKGELFTTKATGMGIGLYVVNHLLKRYHGELHLERRPEGGTKAVVVLPHREGPKGRGFLTGGGAFHYKGDKP